MTSTPPAHVTRRPKPVDMALAAWFTATLTFVIAAPMLRGEGFNFGWDAVVYARAAQALLEGGDPWQTDLQGIFFAAPPPSLVPFIPFAPLPDLVVRLAWVAIGAASAVYVVRALRLPFWWLLFPPLAFGVVAGSSAPLVVALLVRGGAVADAGAVLARIYAALPLVILGRWRSLAATAVALAVTAPFLAWPSFIADWPRIAEKLVTQTGGGLSTLANPITIPLAVVGLVLLGRRRAAWLVVPALWPNTQLYYASIALPVLAEAPLTAAALCLPLFPGLVGVALAADGLLRRLRGRGPERALDARAASPAE